MSRGTKPQRRAGPVALVPPDVPSPPEALPVPADPPVVPFRLRRAFGTPTGIFGPGEEAALLADVAAHGWVVKWHYLAEQGITEALHPVPEAAAGERSRPEGAEAPSAESAGYPGAAETG